MTDFPKSDARFLSLRTLIGFRPSLPAASAAGAEGGCDLHSGPAEDAPLSLPLRRLQREHNIFTEGDGAFPGCTASEHGHLASGCSYSRKRDIAPTDRRDKVTVLRCQAVVNYLPLKNRDLRDIPLK